MPVVVMPVVVMPEVVMPVVVMPLRDIIERRAVSSRECQAVDILETWHWKNYKILFKKYFLKTFM